MSPGEVVGCGGARVRLEEAVVGDVQRDGPERERASATSSRTIAANRDAIRPTPRDGQVV